MPEWLSSTLWVLGVLAIFYGVPIAMDDQGSRKSSILTGVCAVLGIAVVVFGLMGLAMMIEKCGP